MLLSWHRLNDNAASTAVTDSSGNGNNGTAARNTNLTAAVGKVGGAYNANGSSDWAYINEIAIQPPITFCAWINQAATDRYAIALATGNFWRATDNVYGAALQIRASGGFAIEYGNGSIQVADNRRMKYTAAGLISAGNWCHVAGVINSLGNDITLYCNGDVVSGTYSGTYVGNIIYDGTKGGIGWGDNSYFNGLLDDLRIYNEVLTLAQIQKIYNGGNGSPLPYPWLASQRGLLGVLGTAA